MRIGQGWDRHRLAAGRPCILGGIHFTQSEFGPVGHSDGDAVCHALIDALLGAVGMGDIGGMFPDTDERFAGADSMILLKRAWAEVQRRGYRLTNADLTIICEQPAIAPVGREMGNKLALVLDAQPGTVNIKATRGEGLGPEGRRECVTVQAIVLLEEA